MVLLFAVVVVVALLVLALKGLHLVVVVVLVVKSVWLSWQRRMTVGWLKILA